jgi:hypothetical protein
MLIKITKENFFQLFPPETRNVSINGEVICNLGNEVICDICNANAIDSEENTLVVTLYNNRINDCLCNECAINSKQEIHVGEIKLEKR